MVHGDFTRYKRRCILDEVAPTIPIFHTLSEEATSDPRWLLVQRVVASSHLRGSLRLRDFLLYVTECALRGVPEEATEQQIGIHVFGRTAGYNSSEDSIVRTQARILRQKLAAYFAEESSSEDMVIEIPKGQYLPVFRPLYGPAVTQPEVAPTLEPAGDQVQPSHPAKTAAYPWKLPALLAALLIAGIFTWAFWPAPNRPSSDVEKLWRPFLRQDPPLVIYSNALFVGDAKEGMRLATSDNQALPEGGHYIEGYTGVGEVTAVSELTSLFSASRASFILKRSRLVTWDEARDKNLIFIGASSQNPALRVLPSTTDFTIVTSPESAGIANLHPRPGEPTLYSRPERPLTRDYAIVALLPGPQTGKWMMVLSGLTTYGTEAATEFATRPESAAELVRAATKPDGTLHPFEALLEVTINSGVPLKAKLVSIHPR